MVTITDTKKLRKVVELLEKYNLDFKMEIDNSCLKELEKKEESIRLHRILDELAGFIDSHKEHGPEMEFDYYLYGLIWQSLKELLKDKTYGLKAILLLWNWVDNNRKHYLLSARFPWEKHDMDNVNSISDFLLRNYFTNMMFVFLDSAITISPSKEEI